MKIDERIEKVEGQLARVRWISGCLIVGVILCLVTCVMVVFCLAAWYKMDRSSSGKYAEQYRAKSFVLEDDDGKGRAVLGIIENGPALMMLGEDTKQRIKLGMNKKGQGLTIYGEDLQRRINLDVVGGTPRFVFYDEKDQDRFGVVLDKKFLILSLSDKNGQTRASFDMMDETPSLKLYDENSMVTWSTPYLDTNVVQNAPLESGNKDFEQRLSKIEERLNFVEIYVHKWYPIMEK